MKKLSKTQITIFLIAQAIILAILCFYPAGSGGL